ncbi:NAD(P)-binding domain-containing protein [Haemophilus parahaemolyticus]
MYENSCFLGLGAMGSRIASRLVQAGFSVNTRRAAVFSSLPNSVYCC